MNGWILMTATVAALSWTGYFPDRPRQDPSPLRPGFTYESSRGCWDIEIYSTNLTKTEVLSVVTPLDRDNLPTKTKPLVINLARPPKDTEVVVQVYRTAKHHWPCTHSFAYGAEEPTTWVATRGTLTVVAEPPRANQPEYSVMARITNAEFLGFGGVTIRPSQPLEIRTLAGRPDGG